MKVGFPHSEIIGSKLVRSSPTLIAAYHVLHRLYVPRNPPDALKTLDLQPNHHRASPMMYPYPVNTTPAGASVRHLHGRSILKDQVKLFAIIIHGT